MKQEMVEADVLCVGGGIAGLMTAIRASELGANVVVVEKGNTLRSGSGATGNDHFLCYIPEIHGQDMRAFIEAMMETQLGVMGGRRDLLTTLVGKSFDIVKLWDSWGIPMKYNGEYEFAGHAFPGRPIVHLKYNGQDQKLVLTKEALKRGTKIVNRVMIFDLLGNNGSVTGAIGISTREDKLIEFHAKSVVLGTGRCTRLYLGPTPAWMCNLERPPGLTGDGRAMAYRMGAELFGLEMIARHAGPKYFARCGQATWVGVLRDPLGKPIGPFVTKPDRRYGDVTLEVDKSILDNYMKAGRGPVYMDCAGISDDDLEYMRHWLAQEGNVALLDHLKEKGIDPRTNPVEFMTYEPSCAGGVYYDERGETSVKGLYASGDEFRGGICGAAVFGWVAGENAAKYAKASTSPDIDKTKAKIREKKSLLEEIGGREAGPDWKEVNIALQQIMYEYAGLIRSETLLQAGLNHLRRLKEEAYTTLIANNQHDLGRCLEVLNLLELGELVFIAANERKETRGSHRRVDYPLIDPRLNTKLLFVKKVDETPIVEWR